MTQPSDNLALRMSRIEIILDELKAEIFKAMKKHRPMASPHEGYSVILEELDELWDHVKGDTGRSLDARNEALQTAAMGIRYICDLCFGASQ